MKRSSIAVLAWLIAASPSLAIVQRHDRKDQQYLALGERFTAVGRVQPDGSGTLVGPRFVLTAAHVGTGRGGATAVVFEGRSYPVARVIVHPQGRAIRDDQPPEVDLALLVLQDEVASVTPLGLYRGRDEVGRAAFLVGTGDFGAAEKPLTRGDHRRRAATNEVSDAGPLRLFFRFDAPPAGTNLEGVSGPGDSGGPALLETEGRVLLAGVSSASSGPPGRYGLTDVYTRVSTYADWIAGAMVGGGGP